MGVGINLRPVTALLRFYFFPLYCYAFTCCAGDAT